jgi:hypothetical protein
MEEEKPLPQPAGMERFSEVQELNKWETLWIKIQLHELERDLDPERRKNQGGLAI